MSFWQKVNKDVQKGVSEGLAVLRLRANELTEEGKRKYKIFDLKNSVQKEMADLGAFAYAMADKDKNPLEDAKSKRIIAKIKKLETQIGELETTTKKPAAKKKTRKVAAKKTAPKKTTKAKKSS